MHQNIDDIASATTTTQSGPNFDAAALATTLTASLEDAVDRATTFCRANPALAIAGVASVAAIGVIALKSRPSERTLAEKISASLRDAAIEQRERGSDMANHLTSVITSAMKMEPSTIAAYRAIVEDWMQSIRQKAEEVASKVQSK